MKQVLVVKLGLFIWSGLQLQILVTTMATSSETKSFLSQDQAQHPSLSFYSVPIK